MNNERQAAYEHWSDEHSALFIGIGIAAWVLLFVTAEVIICTDPAGHGIHEFADFVFANIVIIALTAILGIVAGILAYLLPLALLEVDKTTLLWLGIIATALLIKYALWVWVVAPRLAGAP